MNPRLVTLISGLISTAGAAQQVWSILHPILAAGRDPTPEEWHELDALADAAHEAVQRA